MFKSLSLSKTKLPNLTGEEKKNSAFNFIFFNYRLRDRSLTISKYELAHHCFPWTEAGLFS